MGEQDLILKSLGIKNFRSFDSEGIFLDNLNKINFLIGKNNSGKSNVLKFLRILSDTNGSLSNFPNTIENQHHKSNDSASILQRITLSELNFPTQFESQNIHGQITGLHVRDYIKEDILFQYNFFDNKFEFITESANSSWNAFAHYKDQIAIALINQLNIQSNYGSPWERLKNYYATRFQRHLIDVCTKIIYIPDKRVIQEDNNIERSNSVINGANLISRLSKMKNYGMGEDEDYENLKFIETKLTEILNVKKIEIQIPSDSKRLVLIVENKRHLLENFGTGVHDLVMLCCILLLNKKKSLVCIEEPEIHMHPELQRRFMKFLEETEHQYIIATHSNTFLDSLNTNASIYHVRYDGVRSLISKSITDNVTREIIDELGYKASDLVQSNGIIWVEGPSDRTYLNKWISLLNPDIKEGIHYTIMFYGGKLLSHLSFETDQENELIQMMKINPNVFILIDKDTAKINNTKERIIKELGEANSWITKGKEIENYILQSVINKWLKNKGLTKIELENSLNTKFENLIKTSNPKFKYENRKNIFAKELAECFELSDLNYHDLTENINRILKAIKGWNEK